MSADGFMKRSCGRKLLPLLLLWGWGFLALAPVISLGADFLEGGGDAVRIVLSDRLYRKQFSYSLFYAVVTVSLGISLALPVAAFIHLLNRRFFRYALCLILFALFLPGQVTMLPNYIAMERLGLLDTPWALILSGIFQPYPVLLLSLGMGLMPRAAWEQFRMESDSVAALFCKVILPWLSPVILVCYALEFARCWNLLDGPLVFLETEEYLPLSLGLFRYRAAPSGEFAAAAFLYMVPPVLLLLSAAGMLYIRQDFPGVREGLSAGRRRQADWIGSRAGRRRLADRIGGRLGRRSGPAFALCLGMGVCLAALGMYFGGRGERTARPEREGKIVLGIRKSFPRLEECVKAFNEGGYGCEVVIREYGSGEDGISEEAAGLRLYADLASGDGPDIMVFDYMEADVWEEAGGMTDLTPYLESSELLGREDFAESVLGAFTREGELLALPRWIAPQTLWGTAETAGSLDRWTVSEMLELMERHPGVPLTADITRDGFLSFCLSYTDESTWKEWGRGEDSSLRKLLELAASYPQQAEYVSLEEACRQLQNGEALLLEMDLSGLGMLRMVKIWTSGEGLYPVGYPASDGNPRAIMNSAGGVYAIPLSASNKDGAWAFLERFFAGELDPDGTEEDEEKAFSMWDGIPVVKRELEDAFREEERRTEAMGIELPPFQERQEVEELMAMADVRQYALSPVLDILLEEARPYFEGTKELEDVLEVIRRRISLYFQEKSVST